MQKQFHISLNKVISLADIIDQPQVKKAVSRLVHPEDINDLTYWAKKSRISPRQLNDAILNTGSLDPARLKAYLKEHTWRKFIFAFSNLIKTENCLLFMFKNHGHKEI